MCRLLIAAGVALLLVIAPATAGAPQALAPAATQPSLADLIASLSESGGYFDTDNLISNERSYLHVVPALRVLAGQAGNNGVYLGVGPDQNFSYIAHLRPTLAVVIDIRRDNLLLHLLFKAMFSEAATRADYLSLLTGRSQRPAPRDASIESLVRLVEEAKPLARTEVARVQARLAEVIDGFDVPLSDKDHATIARFHRRFVDAGLSLRFNTTGRPPQHDYPTYRDLLLEVDRNAVPRSFLASEEDFQFVKSMHARDRIVPIVGDLAGRRALANVGRYLDASGLRVSAFYTSNVEFYLFRDGSAQAFMANLARLPRQSGSIIVRSVFTGDGARVSPGYNSASVTQPIQDLLDGFQQGRFRQYLGTGPIAGSSLLGSSPPAGSSTEASARNCWGGRVTSILLR